jgi:TPR repeat protein
LLRELVPQGSTEALVLLGDYHTTGKGGVKVDLAEARRLFEAASRGGNDVATRRLEAMKTSAR